MDIQKIHLSTADEYANFVRAFVTLLDKQLSVWEDYAKNKEELHELAGLMPALISLVNTVGYLRGQDGVFTDLRPQPENQSEFYRYENLFEERLEKLINIFMSSDEKEYYQERLEFEFIKSRTKQKSTV